MVMQFSIIWKLKDNNRVEYNESFKMDITLTGNTNLK